MHGSLVHCSVLCSYSTVWKCKVFKVKWANLVQNQSAKVSYRDAKHSFMSRDNNKMHLFVVIISASVFIFKFYNMTKFLNHFGGLKDQWCCIILQLYFKDIWTCIAYFQITCFQFEREASWNERIIGKVKSQEEPHRRYRGTSRPQTRVSILHGFRTLELQK